METYDAILVLGRGIDQEGNIPDSAKDTVNKAVDLYKKGVSERIIFSGKWSYKYQGEYSTTEAEAMAEYARELGLPEDAILIENESDDTVTNVYFIKTKFLIPNNWRKVLLVTIEVIETRAFMILKKVLGPDYRCDVVVVDYKLPEDIREDVIRTESKKVEWTRKSSKKFKDRDHESIYKADREIVAGLLNGTIKPVT